MNKKIWMLPHAISQFNIKKYHVIQFSLIDMKINQLYQFKTIYVM